jgi:hypothetical protein
VNNSIFYAALNVQVYMPRTMDAGIATSRVLASIVDTATSAETYGWSGKRLRIGEAPDGLQFCIVLQTVNLELQQLWTLPIYLPHTPLLNKEVLS